MELGESVGAVKLGPVGIATRASRRAVPLVKMMTHHLKFLLAMLTGFALGVALSAAWFIARQPPVPLPSPGTGRATGDAASNEISPSTAAPSVPWTGPKARKAGAAIASEPDKTGDAEVPDKHILAQRNHEARTRALRMSSWLGFDSGQAASFEALLLEKGADGILEIPGDLEPWLKANLSPEQADAHARYQESIRKDEAEASALKEVHEIARAIELSDEQRDALFQKKFEFNHNLFVAGLDYLVLTGLVTPIRTENVAITESRIEMPVFSTRPAHFGILTEEQAQVYGEFKRKERELEELRARETE